MLGQPRRNSPAATCQPGVIEVPARRHRRERQVTASNSIRMDDWNLLAGLLNYLERTLPRNSQPFIEDGLRLKWERTRLDLDPLGGPFDDVDDGIRQLLAACRRKGFELPDDLPEGY